MVLLSLSETLQQVRIFCPERLLFTVVFLHHCIITDCVYFPAQEKIERLL
ncbi:hypothetical protein KKHLCK_07175 [Candidatus Electrothrix laxa]